MTLCILTLCILCGVTNFTFCITIFYRETNLIQWKLWNSCNSLPQMFSLSVILLTTIAILIRRALSWRVFTEQCSLSCLWASQSLQDIDHAQFCVVTCTESYQISPLTKIISKIQRNTVIGISHVRKLTKRFYQTWFYRYSSQESRKNWLKWELH